MTTIFYSKISNYDKTTSMRFLKKYCNAEVQQRLSKSSSLKYINRRIAFWKIIPLIYQDIGIPISRLKYLKHNSYGKLVTEDYNISISYTGDYVFVLLSKSKIGLDVECVNMDFNQKKLKMLQELMHLKIKNKSDFFNLWTKIESIVKYYDDKSLADIFFGMLYEQSSFLQTRSLLFKKEYYIALSGNAVSLTTELITIKKI